ncbi:flavin reductase family protein [Sinorhizobium medicae]|uniref:Flavin reductase domain-containing protein n=1 Tax=Sinorhizobium medicae TaxID=110321 RepID=A0A508X8X9_9HYPH|nr:flavin reductase family protein [Sinorhizobium medicae]VTZ65444.1 Flavin reductase domain-containing protein [Sinorhizobium medicae]
MEKNSFPLIDVRQHLETGPIVMVSSAHGGKRNIMTMGWHMMMQFSPALFGCFIWNGNYSYQMIRDSRECVINVPTVDIVDKVISVGNTSGRSTDKFSEFDLTPERAKYVDAPLIKECYANFECRLYDDTLIDKYSIFVWEVVKAHVADIGAPQTIHYRGEAKFMVAGKEISFPERFLPQNL